MMTFTRLTTAVAGMVLMAGGTSLLAQEGKPDDKKAPPAATQPAATPVKKDDKKTETPAKEQLVFVQLETSMGNILLELNQTKAPLSVENFLRYVEKGHYAGTIFHRVINGFMIQGGGFDASMAQKPTDAPIKNEYTNGLQNLKYTVAMARTNAPDSATAQFYINVADNGALDRASPRTGGAGYAVFGRVVAGTDVVEKIKAVKTGVKGQMPDVPVEDVVIKSAKKLTEEEATKIKNAANAAKSDTAKPAPAPATKPEEKK